MQQDDTNAKVLPRRAAGRMAPARHDSVTVLRVNTSTNYLSRIVTRQHVFYRASNLLFAAISWLWQSTTPSSNRPGSSSNNFVLLPELCVPFAVDLSCLHALAVVALAHPRANVPLSRVRVCATHTHVNIHIHMSMDTRSNLSGGLGPHRSSLSLPACLAPRPALVAR